VPFTVSLLRRVSTPGADERTDPQTRAISRPVSDLGGNLVHRGLRGLAGTDRPESCPELGREPLKQRVVRLVLEDRHAGDRPRGSVDPEVGVVEAGLGAQLLRPEGRPAPGELIGLALGWLDTHDPHVHHDPSWRTPRCGQWLTGCWATLPPADEEPDSGRKRRVRHHGASDQNPSRAGWVTV
jgi:hypothetical protein